MAATPALSALERAGIEHVVHRYRHDPRNTSYGDEAVTALAEAHDVVAGQVFKTLVIALTGGSRRDDRLAVAVLPVPATLSMKAAAAALGAAKATMAAERVVARSTGYVFGGVSPIGQRTTLATVVDTSALGWPRIFCSGGRRGLEIGLSPRDLVAVTGAVTADITA